VRTICAFLLIGLLTGLAFSAFPGRAMADGVESDVLRKILGTGRASIKPLSRDEALRLTTDQDKIIRLQQDAASVIVNNPNHAVVMLDSPRLLIVMPRQPGTTSFSVLDAQGNTILHKQVIVSNVQQQYVRVRRVCGASDASCVPAAYYYCPDGCYEVTPVAADAQGAVPPPPAQPANTAAGLAGEQNQAPAAPTGASP
jgi:Flp pilus assembly secretin CpaC